MEWLVIWCLGAIIVGVLAARYKRSGPGWFFLALLISPLLAGLFVLAAGRRKPGQDLWVPKVEPRYMVDTEGKTTEIPDAVLCPYCAEPIKPQAIKCKHCGSEVAPAIIGSGMTATEAKEYDLARIERKAEDMLH